MTFYGVVDGRSASVIEFFLRRADADRFVTDCLTDEPDWVSVLRVESFDFGELDALN